mgnify:CR=1 FL=1
MVLGALALTGCGQNGLDCNPRNYINGVLPQQCYTNGQQPWNPGTGQPGFGQPGFGQPGFGQPGFGQPVFGQPGFGFPAQPPYYGPPPGFYGPNPYVYPCFGNPYCY